MLLLVGVLFVDLFLSGCLLVCDLVVVVRVDDVRVVE